MHVYKYIQFIPIVIVDAGERTRGEQEDEADDGGEGQTDSRARERGLPAQQGKGYRKVKIMMEHTSMYLLQ